MGRNLTGIATAAILLVVLGFAIASAQTIGGVVLDRTTGEPIDSVRVYIVQQAGGPRDSTLSDAAGRWHYDFSASYVHEQASPPTDLAVSPFYPNPFFPATILALSLPRADRVRIAVYDMRGRLVEEGAFAQGGAASTCSWPRPGAPQHCAPDLHELFVQIRCR